MSAALGLSGLQLRAWQRDAYGEWVGTGRSAVVEAVTGTGKTTLGIAAAGDAATRGLSVLVVVPGIELLEQWHRSIRTALPDVSVGRRGGGHRDTFARNQILISTVQSAISKSAPTAPGAALLVADEVHRYGAATFSRLLTDAFPERIGLTATFERSDDGVERFLLPYFGNVIEGCTYARGHADGILAPVRVMLVAVPFTPTEAGEYNELDATARNLRRDLIEKHGCRRETFGEFMIDVQILSDGINAERSTWIARKYLQAFSRRRAVLAECEGKLATLRTMGEVLREQGRALVFSETKASSQAAAAVLNDEGVLAAPFTSDLNRVDRSSLLESFKVGAMTALVAPKVLDEGVDVPEADVGIILASSKSRRQMIQRMGRVVRPKTDGRAASFVVLFAANSSEDPLNGAHGTFLEQLTEIAEENVTVDPDDAADLLRIWLGGNQAHPIEAPAEQDVDREFAEIAQRLIEDETPDLADAAADGDEVRAVLRSVRQDGRSESLDLVLACLSILDARQLAVMVHRYGMGVDPPMRWAEVGARVGLSASRASGVEKSAIDFLCASPAAELLTEMISE